MKAKKFVFITVNFGVLLSLWMIPHGYDIWYHLYRIGAMGVEIKAREYYQLLADWITEEGYEYAYFYDDSATSEILRLLDYKNEDVTYLAVNQEGNTIVYDYYSKYINQPMVSEKSVLVIMDMYDDKIEFCGKEYTRRNTIGIMSFYDE